MRLTWHSYNYYPYERELAAREIATLLGQNKIRAVEDGIELQGIADIDPADRLTYFSGTLNSNGFVPTVQAKLEEAGRKGKNKQATRYSVHGLHDYKGKFNPQVVRALLNIFGIEPQQRVFDPFCGSGTTLVECAHLGAFGVGADINPLAIYIAQAKLQALCTPEHTLRKIYKRLCRALSKRPQMETVRRDDNPRNAYLKAWFDLDVLTQIEHVRSIIKKTARELAPFFLIIASNLLRDYSQQDPNDLRIRRRKSPLPEQPFTLAFLDAVSPLLLQVNATQAILGTDLIQGHALLQDVREVTLQEVGGRFDAAITSPPYATALPYIDTQRLSLIWLEFLQPDRIMMLESELIGSRELRGKSRRVLLGKIQDNSDNLPSEQLRICVELNNALSEQDGFRRQAVPILLYRYFASMRDSFRAVKKVMKPGAPYGLIVGHNHTTLGGIRHEINTPQHLADLASSEGWDIEELIPLQTYQRYGYHMNNSVAAETLIILRNTK